MEQLQFDFEALKTFSLGRSFEDLIVKHRAFGLYEERSQYKLVREQIKQNIVKIKKDDLDVYGTEWIFLPPARKTPFTDCNTYGFPTSNRYYVYTVNRPEIYGGHKKIGVTNIDAICIKYANDRLQISILGHKNTQSVASYVIEDAQHDSGRFEATSVFDFAKNIISINESMTGAKYTSVMYNAKGTRDTVSCDIKPEYTSLYPYIIFEYLMKNVRYYSFFQNYKTPQYISDMCDAIKILFSKIYNDVNKRYFNEKIESIVDKEIDKIIKPRFIEASALRDLLGEYSIFRDIVKLTSSRPLQLQYEDAYIVNHFLSILVQKDIPSKYCSISEYIKDMYPAKGDDPFHLNKWIVGQLIRLSREMHSKIETYTFYEEDNRLRKFCTVTLKLVQLYYTWFNHDLKNFDSFLQKGLVWNRYYNQEPKTTSWYDLLLSKLNTQQNDYIIDQFFNAACNLSDELKCWTNEDFISSQKASRIITTLLTDVTAANVHIISDTARMLRDFRINRLDDIKEINIRDVTDVTTLHNNLSKTLTLLRHKPVDNTNKAYDSLKEFIADNPVIFDKYSLVIPRSSVDMIEWGTEQKHCIASYTHQINNTAHVYLGVKDNNTKQWLGHMQVTKSGSAWIVNQFYGRQNSRIDTKIHTDFCELVTKVLSTKPKNLEAKKSGEEEKKLVSV